MHNGIQHGYKGVQNGYIAAMKWADLPEGSDNPIIDTETLINCHIDIISFINAISMDDFHSYLKLFDVNDLGHDFWLTRQGHGAGFWDRGLGGLGDRLTKHAEQFKALNVFVQHDLLITE